MIHSPTLPDTTGTAGDGYSIGKSYCLGVQERPLRSAVRWRSGMSTSQVAGNKFRPCELARHWLLLSSLEHTLSDQGSILGPSKRKASGIWDAITSVGLGPPRCQRHPTACGWHNRPQIAAATRRISMIPHDRYLLMPAELRTLRRSVRPVVATDDGFSLHYCGDWVLHLDPSPP